jgi:hypothetical protein
MPSLGSAEGNRTSGGFPLCNNAKLNFMSAFFFDTRGPKKKAWQKRNAAKGVSPLRRRPTLRALDRRRLLKKAGENFCADIAVKSPTNQNLKNQSFDVPFIKKEDVDLSTLGAIIPQKG